LPMIFISACAASPNMMTSPAALDLKVTITMNSLLFCYFA
jgi:hypothetical protein